MTLKVTVEGTAPTMQWRDVPVGSVAELPCGRIVLRCAQEHKRDLVILTLSDPDGGNRDMVVSSWRSESEATVKPARVFKVAELTLR